MSKWAPFALILVLIGALAVSCDGNKGWGKWEASRDSVLAQVDSAATLRGLRERDSLQQFIAEHLGMAERESSVANRLTGVSRAYRKVSDSLKSLLPTLTNTRDSLQNASGRIISLEVALDTSEAAIGRLEAARTADSLAIRALVADTLRLHISDSAGWASVDSLRALVGRVPKGCRILGVPCPTVQVGYGAVLSGGTVRMGPSVGIGFKVPF